MMDETPAARTPEQEPTFLAANRLKIFIAAFVLVGALSYFGFMAFKSATVYYYTVTELKELSLSDSAGVVRAGTVADASGQTRLIRVSGKLVPESFDRPEDSITAYFQLTDGRETLMAAHEGVVPDLFFNEHSEIILEGNYEDGVFHSENVIVKCPSKYVAKENSSG
ncbi:MAG: cytochrome c maturation protein CcmE [SAR202 cluster bacterium]|nr:cytochrome c maturation protein CcmE [SAR202 cluster bacterium]